MVTKPLPRSLQESLELRASRYETQMNRDAAQYLMARGIDRPTAERFRLGVVAEPVSPDDQPFQGRLVIPYIGPRGNVYGMKFRAIREDDHGPKYLNLGGLAVRPFNLRAVVEAGHRIAVCEGELDAVVLDACGVPAVAIAGVEHWDKRFSRFFVGFAEVVVVGDGDAPGGKFSERVQKDVYASRRVILPDGEDINSLFLKHGREGVLGALGLDVDIAG